MKNKTIFSLSCGSYKGNDRVIFKLNCNSDDCEFWTKKYIYNMDDILKQSIIFMQEVIKEGWTFSKNGSKCPNCINHEKPLTMKEAEDLFEFIGVNEE